MNKIQIDLLKRINETDLFDYSNLSPAERDILYYLRDNKFITPKSAPGSGQRPFFKITELGKAELFKTKQINFRFWIPIIITNFISLISLIISIIALLK